LLLAMSNPGARDSFARGGNEDVLREAIVVVMGADFAVETMVDPSATGTPSAGASRTPQGEQAPIAGPSGSDFPVTRAANGSQNAIAEDPDEVASRDDSDLTEDAPSHTELLARHLGAEIIAEEDHGA
jgi:DNA polymerase-3 subunit gamma/tau